MAKFCKLEDVQAAIEFLAGAVTISLWAVQGLTSWMEMKATTAATIS
jgi:hypothetical protein